MSESESPPPPQRRRFPKRIIAAATGVALIAGGASIALGPAAAWIVDHLADGQRVWRIGNITIDGVSGGWLGDLRAERVTIADADGVWLEADNLDLKWRPQDLIAARFWLDAAHADAIRILRQPALTEKGPGGGGSFDVHLGDIQIDHLELAEAVVGEAAQFTSTLKMSLRDDALRSIDLALNRTDSDADNITVLYRAGADYAMLASVAGAPGGIISRLLGVPEQSVAINAVGDGDLQTGGARYEGAIGGEELLHGETRWTPTRWTSTGAARLDVLPGLRVTAQRIGASATLDASGEREGAFQAQASTPFFSVNLQGRVNEAYELDGPAHFVATTQRLSDIAREAPFEMGAAALEGELRQGNGVTAIRATLDAQRLNIIGHDARMTGPVEAALDANAFTLSADLSVPEHDDPLFNNARLRTQLEYNRERGRFELKRSTLTGDAIEADAQGWVTDGDGEFSGAWRIKQIEAFAPDLRGGASGQYRAYSQEAGEDHIWITSVSGTGSGISGAPEIVPQLLGPAPQLDGLFRYENGGITVSHARVNGRQLRAAATGRIVQGQADLALEATARGPLSLGEAQIAGAVDATGRLTGRIAQPTLRADAQLSSFAASGVVVAQPRVVFTLAPNGNEYRGQAEVHGNVSGQPLVATSNLGVRGSTIALDDLIAHVGALEATGTATIAPTGVTAQLALGGAIDNLAPGASGRVQGNVSLTPQMVNLDAHLADARLGDLRLRAATITANGPFSAIQAHFDMRGALRRAPLTFRGNALIANTERQGTNIQIQGEGALAGAEISTRTPITLAFNDVGMDGTLDVAIADGALNGQWRERRRALSGSVTIDDAPLAPLAAIWGEAATGRIDGTMSLANAGGGLSGRADVTLANARIAGRQRGTLDMHLVGDLDPNRVTATLDATSSDGLVARFEANAPVTTSANPIRIALARERRGHATWSLRGPADTLWAAARLQDQQLTGTVQGEGELDFGAGYLAGDGQLEIVDGRFEDKLTGITLVDLDALVSIGQRGVNIERFTASGPRGGRMSVSGGSSDPQHGEIVVNLDNMWVADRSDARARASGELTLAWQGLQSSLEGDLNIAQADISIASNPEAGIPTMDVVEINRPGDEDWLEETQAPSERAAATTLNVRVRAPGRVFTRGRGIDAEWSLDMRLAGTAAEPRVFGEANIVRGQLALSGQPFDLQRGRILFNGNPMYARLDITAERDTADLTARINISGTATDPEVSLSSDPALPEDEILPQVLFGRSVEDLSPLEAAQIAAALASLAGRSSFDLVDAARVAAGLDRFNVRQDESGGLLVAGGVYLTRNVYVEVARSGLGEAQTSIEWTVRPRLVLITSFLGNNDQRVSLRWRHESD